MPMLEYNKVFKAVFVRGMSQLTIPLPYPSRKFFFFFFFFMFLVLFTSLQTVICDNVTKLCIAFYDARSN